MFSNRIWIVWDEQLIILSLVESSFLTFSTHHHLIPFVPKKIPSARRQCLPREEVQSVVKREKLKSMDIRTYMNIIQHEHRSWCVYLFLKCHANCFGDGESSQTHLLSFLSGHGTYTQYGWNQHVRTVTVHQQDHANSHVSLFWSYTCILEIHDKVTFMLSLCCWFLVI